ncbi:hypothetical protein GPAL_0166 [Glaciecola pallidula DSM 14239 = ACAM 615]|uniref:Uncharacterized protein n=1 Tax=Brumicola pallidula DSM 14239 = ACAM 615 TaxID=1121922 RepID=K6Z9I5_9ALTE|nr:hypothetical protein GPAL_0166 [Glaciecola pallidula DSM 14239 = ACAM 615]
MHRTKLIHAKVPTEFANAILAKETVTPAFHPNQQHAYQ